MKLVFAGTPEFSVAPLQTLIDSGHTVVAVYTQPDRPAGRGRKLSPSPVKQLAASAGLAVRQPDSLRDPQAQAELAALAPDLMVVVAYGLLLPQAVLDIPRLGCVNIHASLLPRWRGAAPIQRAILAGDTETGVGLMQMEKGLDTGPVLAEARCPIAPDDTASTLHDRLSELGARLLAGNLDALLAGQLTAAPQSEAGATYARKLDKAEAGIDWQQDAAAIDRQIRAFNPWPVAQTRLNGEVLRIHAARPVAASGEAGRILEAGRDGITVACGQGGLRLTEIQLPGKRRTAAADLANARPLNGLRLGD